MLAMHQPDMFLQSSEHAVGFSDCFWELVSHNEANLEEVTLIDPVLSSQKLTRKMSSDLEEQAQAVAEAQQRAVVQAQSTKSGLETPHRALKIVAPFGYASNTATFWIPLVPN